jgi:hypothetical protein
VCCATRASAGRAAAAAEQGTAFAGDVWLASIELYSPGPEEGSGRARRSAAIPIPEKRLPRLGTPSDRLGGYSRAGMGANRTIRLLPTPYARGREGANQSILLERICRLHGGRPAQASHSSDTTPHFTRARRNWASVQSDPLRDSGGASGEALTPAAIPFSADLAPVSRKPI